MVVFKCETLVVRFRCVTVGEETRVPRPFFDWGGAFEMVVWAVQALDGLDVVACGGTG